MQEADIGVIGLGVMGKSLIMNMLDHKIKVAVFNRTKDKTEELLSHPLLIKTYNLSDFLCSIRKPHIILFMINAGAIDEMVLNLLPLLNREDIVIDGGNSYYIDTMRRSLMFHDKGMHFIGMGISGGEMGARLGPSMMVGGDKKAWSYIEPIFTKIAARAEDKTVCIAWLGDNGAGHFVKMVHNAIEYSIMQLICELFDFMRHCLKLNMEQMADVFSSWNFNSYLLDITSSILKEKKADNTYVLDDILDVCEHKGSGKWALMAALNLSVPFNMTQEALFLRFLSTLKILREEVAGEMRIKLLNASPEILSKLKNGFFAAFYLSYVQGFMLLKKASDEYKWHLNMSSIASIWKAGCIIRADLLNDIERAFKEDVNLSNLLLNKALKHKLLKCEDDFREVVVEMVKCKIPTPCFSASLAFFDSIRRGELSSNLIQAQRDFFGAHLYEKKDEKRGKFFHHEWIN
jgi:6-phosphogluconate dehydrogenase